MCVDVGSFLQELIDTNAQSERSCCFAASQSSWTTRCKAKPPSTAAFTELIGKWNIIHLQEKLRKFAGSGDVLQKANSHLNMHEKGAHCDPHE